MNERTMQFRVGVMIVLAVLAALFLVTVLGKPYRFISGKYTIYVKFAEAPGVTAETPVRKSGIRIGQVKKVEFTEEDQVLVTAEIDNDRRLRHNEVCRISSTLLGDASLEFMLSTDRRLKPTPVEPGETINGVLAPAPAQAMANLQDRLTQAITAVDDTSRELSGAARKIFDILDKNEAQINKVLVHTDEALQAIKLSAGYANDVMGDPNVRAQFRTAINQLPGMMEETQKTVTSLRGAIQSANDNLDNLKQFTEPLGHYGDKVIMKLDQGADRLNAVLTDLHTFTKALNNEQGTLGQLVNNPEMYQHLNRAAKNIDEVSRQFKPILDDARVFTDKVSRHPGVIVRDAVRPGPGIK